MKKLFVEDVKVGISKGGIACGPVPGHMVAEVCLRDEEEGTVKYYSLAEVEGIPNFCEMDISTFDRQIEEVDDEEFWNMISEHIAGDFSDYWDFFENQEEMKLHDSEHLLIYKLLICLVRSDWEEIDQMKALSIGKHLEDFEIPVSDIEQEYLDNIADDDSEDEESENLADYLEMIDAEFVGNRINVSSLDLKEDETPEAWYSSFVKFQEDRSEYKLTYGFGVNDAAMITSVDEPKLEKLVGEEYVPCPIGEVSAKRIYEVLGDELNSWL